MGNMGEIFKDTKEEYAKIYDRRAQNTIAYLIKENIPFKVITDREIQIKSCITYYPAKFWTVNAQNKKQGRGWDFFKKQIKITR